MIVFKGIFLSVTGDIIEMDCTTGHVMRVSRAQVQLLEKRIPNWYKESPLKIKKTSGICLLRSDNETMSIDVYPDRNVVSVKFGNFMKDVNLSGEISWNVWTFIMAGFSPDGCNLFIEQLSSDASRRIVTEEIYKGF